MLGFSALKNYCTLGPSHPRLRNEDWHLTAFNFIGVVTLKYESELFLVFWGDDSGAWSCIQTMESLWLVGEFAIGSDLSDEDAANTVVQYMRQHETGVRGLMSIFRTFPSFWVYPEQQWARQFVDDLVERLTIRRTYTTVEFICRKVPQIELTAKVLPKERSISSPLAQRVPQ